MKPPLCICNGPFVSRAYCTWTWGHEGEWYEYLPICPIHGHEYRAKVDEQSKGKTDPETKESR